MLHKPLGDAEQMLAFFLALRVRSSPIASNVSSIST